MYLQITGFGLSPKTIFGDNYEMLVELKKKYDARNVFRNCIDLLGDVVSHTTDS